MVEDPQRTNMVTLPLTARPAWWGCGGLAVGAVIGALVMLLALIAFAPRPQTASPGAGGQNGNLVINMDDTYLTTQVSAAISQAKLPIALSNIKAEIMPEYAREKLRLIVLAIFGMSQWIVAGWFD